MRRNVLNCHLEMSYLRESYILKCLFITTLFCNSLIVCIFHLNLLQRPPGRSPKTLNGLLSPHLEQPLTHSQTSLCEMLQEKEKKWPGGGGIGSMGNMDHSSLIPLRSKNFRERSDAHFVDVIKEDR